MISCFLVVEVAVILIVQAQKKLLRWTYVEPNSTGSQVMTCANISEQDGHQDSCRGPFQKYFDLQFCLLAGDTLTYTNFGY